MVRRLAAARSIPPLNALPLARLHTDRAVLTRRRRRRSDVSESYYRDSVRLTVFESTTVRTLLSAECTLVGFSVLFLFFSSANTTTNKNEFSLITDEYEDRDIGPATEPNGIFYCVLVRAGLRTIGVSDYASDYRERVCYRERGNYRVSVF